jgi:hypothetical protein
MILCLAQMTPCWNDPLSGLKKIRTCVAEAVEGDASFIAFPEQFLTGWDPNDTSWTFDESEEEISQLREIARDYSIGILGSFREKRNGPPRNTCIAIGPHIQKFTFFLRRVRIDIMPRVILLEFFLSIPVKLDLLYVMISDLLHSFRHIEIRE